MSRKIERNEIIKRLCLLQDFSEYSIDSDSINGISKKAVFIHKGCENNNNIDYNFTMAVKDFISGQRCPKCAAKNRIIHNTKNTNTKKEKIHKGYTKDITEYISKINSDINYQFINSAENYHGSQTKVNILHRECGNVFTKRISDFIYNEQRCPKCAKSGKRNDISSVIKNFKKHGFTLVDTKNYPGTHNKVLLRCDHCGEVQEHSYNTIVNLNGKCSCQKKQFKGETLIKKYLNENNIEFIQNKTFEDLIYHSNLRIDFYISSLNAIIEYDGKQHFSEYTLFNNDNKKTRISRDIIKNKYAEDHSIRILRISYKVTTYNEIKKILDTFLKNRFDGKPYDGKLSRTVWVGGKSDYSEYIKYNS